MVPLVGLTLPALLWAATLDLDNNGMSDAWQLLYNATELEPGDDEDGDHITNDLQIPDQITTFTASDFGRTFPTNGEGSDHGWGNHQIVMGGAVNGNQIYGTMPVLEVDGPDDTRTGRWIPTTSVDEYSATMAKWFGISDLDAIFPNLHRFSKPDLGFLA